MLFEQLISDALFTSSQKNLIYQIEEFKKKLPGIKKMLHREFLSLGMFNYYAKLYSHFAYTNIIDALAKIDLKTSYDLKKLTDSIKNKVVPFIQKDLLVQLTENHFKMSEYKNNLIVNEVNHSSVPKNFEQVIKTCFNYYKNLVLKDKKNNKVKELSKEIAKNKKISESYSPIVQKIFKEFEKVTQKKDYYEYEIYSRENRLETIRTTIIGPDRFEPFATPEELEKLKESYSGTQKKIDDLNAKITELKPYAEKYGKIYNELKAKLDEIYDENQIFIKKINSSIEEQKTIISTKSENKKMFRLLSELNRKLIFHPKASKDVTFE